MPDTKLTDSELLFLRALCRFEHGHVSQDTLRARLEEQGFEGDEFKKVKKKLLYAGMIGIVYGNITFEDKSILELIEKHV
ncbi:MAG: hypothetical protein NWE89_01415 [Candidatus Bathyarchaeota archaeon]|nr:hypothetical protein [Candidatus Bathyarchaeota archaeon]